MPVSGAPYHGCESRPGRGGGPGRTEHDCRLPRSLRISDSNVFKEAFESGAKYVGKLMVMWLRRGDGACLRLGVVTSKRSFRRAVDRARARRMLREAYRLNRHRLAGECDVVLVGRSRILDAGLDKIEAELLKLAGKAGILGTTK